MNATKENQAAAPVDPTRSRFRRVMASAAIAAAVFAAVRVGIVRFFDLQPGQPIHETLLWSALSGLLLVYLVTYLVMTLMPATARRYGLPALPGDERERHNSHHAYQVAYLVGLLGTVILAVVTDSGAAFAVSVAIQLSFFGTLVVHNRKA